MTRRDLPSGTLTLLFTDVEGSTKLLSVIGNEAYAQVLAEHHRLCRKAWAAHGGVEVDTEGDAFFVVFEDPAQAVAAAREAQEALASAPVKVRMGLHTGEVLLRETGYVGHELHRAARIAASAHGGQVVCSQTTRLAAGDGFPFQDLGEHRFKDFPQPIPIYQLGEGSFPPLKTISNTNLPRPASSFVGREQELEQVLSKIEDGARLLTVTGPGGSGKTRLALEAAATLVPEYKAGVFWVGLASLRDSALVSETISQTLGAKDGLAEHIGERELCLLIDNLEQVIAAAPELSRLLQACPNLTLLCTSRELLRIQGEVEYEVPPLASPEAVSLFCERSGLETSDEIAELCACLDNLPLAVELAAARTKALSPAQILERVSQRLDLLKGGRDADPRQQTLRATFEWSYDLLSEEEQRLFRALSVFSGGCALEAAEEVAGTDLDTLQSLLEKSLLRHTDGRFWMLETIREFAGERFEESGEADTVRGLHVEFFVALADRRYADLRGGDAALWLQRFDEEHDNFRSTLAYLLARDPPTALRLAGRLSRFWMSRGHLAEGRHWLETTLLACPTDAGRSRALLGAGLIALEQGEVEWAEAAAREALELDRRARDEEGIAQSMLAVADVAACRGELDNAARWWEETAELARANGLRLELAIALYNLGQVARHQGEHEVAESRFEEAGTTFAEVEDVRGQAGALFGLLEIATARGDVERALSMLAVATELMARVRYMSGLLDALELYAGLLEKIGNAEVAAQLAAARESLGDDVGRRHHPLEVAAHDETVGRIRSALGDEGFERAWELGSAMTLDEAVAFALQQRSPLPDPT